ncbi:MAG: type II secretion system protein [Phycisphaeraceae bacterium]|nr:MAG: type II secretion system protein [Phycisphaeraceae bacterium]
MRGPAGHDRGLPEAAPRRAARGFTLIEIVLALGILVAIASLGVPPLLRTFDERVFESASQRLEASLWTLAATASDEGVPRAVWIESDAAGGLTLRSGRVEAGRVIPEVAGTAGEDPVGPSGRIEMELPRDWRIEPDDPEADEPGGSVATEGPSRRVIAVFLPDGSAHSAGSPLVLAGRERGGVSPAVRLTVNRWTSRAAVEAFTIDRLASDRGLGAAGPDPVGGTP